MREPYRTMFDGFEGHWLLGQYLLGDEPDWLGLSGCDRFDDLSNGEKVLVDFAAGWKNVTIHLDAGLQYQVALALKKVL